MLSFNSTRDTTDFEKDRTTYTPASPHPWLQYVVVDTLYENPNDDDKKNITGVRVTIFPHEGNPLAAGMAKKIEGMRVLSQPERKGSEQDFLMLISGKDPKKDAPPWIWIEANNAASGIESIMRVGELPVDMQHAILSELKSIWAKVPDLGKAR